MQVLVTGSDGLVGTAIKTISPDFIYVTRKDADLTKEDEVERLFKKYRPDAVVHAAAKVGGIGGNMSGHGEYFHQNILMNTHVIHNACLHGVKKLLVFSSVCVFPDGIPFLREDFMHGGEPFTGNFAYAHAKRMVDIQIQAYKSQYGIKNYCSLIPGNIFGKRDLYNLQHGHVIPSLIHKIYLAKKNKTPLKVWGDGTPLREFIYSEDLARIINKLLSFDEIPLRVLVSGDKQYSIKEVVGMLCRVAKFDGDVVWETDKPNGQKARPTDLSLLKSLVGEFNYTDMYEALKESYDWFENNYEAARK